MDCYAGIGIDVSSYQGDIDWKKVKDAGIEYAFIRCKSAISGEDKNFTTNMYGATSNGIPVGVYYYSGATSDEELVQEVNYLLGSVKNYQVALPLVLDIEGPAMSKLPTERLQRNITLFNSLIESAGYVPMVYSNTNFFKNKIGDIDTLKWEANYRTSKAPNARYWQYSSKGHVDGINGFVDMNKSLSTISCNIIE